MIGDEPRVEIPGEYASDSIFFLTGGFGATEYSICPDADGRFAARIMLPREEK